MTDTLNNGDVLTQTALQQIMGWLIAGETWTYASASTFTISGDVTTKYPVGTKIKLTQTTVKYFYVIGTSYGAPNTTITVTGGSDYSLANAAITSPYYSYADCPQGHPIWFNWVTTATGFTAAVVFTQSVFRIVGSMCETLARGLSGTSNATTFTWTVPIACIATVNFLDTPVCIDNGGNIQGRSDLGANTTVIMYSSIAAGVWTNSGQKGLYAAQFKYPY
mgnify:FL=1